LVHAFLKKWWVESVFKMPNLPLSLRLKVAGCHYNSIYNNTWTKQVKQLSKTLLHHTLIKKYFWYFCNYFIFDKLLHNLCLIWVKLKIGKEGGAPCFLAYDHYLLKCVPSIPDRNVTYTELHHSDDFNSFSYIFSCLTK
jgi:hypothetical protein